MRIIGGLLKGKLFKSLKNINTRPLKDAVKENIFNIIVHSKDIEVNLKNSNVLDLYSGIGSFGIECISREAKKVTFVEHDSQAFFILEQNLNHLSIIRKANLFNNKIENFLKDNKKKKYNIFFFDPPFSDKTYFQNLSFIKENQMFEDNHLIIIHREAKGSEKLDDVIRIINLRKYGRSKIIFGIFN